MIVLDTHALLWWASDKSKLSKKALSLVDRESRHTGQLLVSIISVWEIAMLVDRSRLALKIEINDFIGQLKNYRRFSFYRSPIESHWHLSDCQGLFKRILQTDSLSLQRKLTTASLSPLMRKS